jgi:hypothetical protein
MGSARAGHGVVAKVVGALPGPPASVEKGPLSGLPCGVAR